MFAARNRAGEDKSLPLDAIVDTNKKPAAKKARQTGFSLERGRKGPLIKGRGQLPADLKVKCHLLS